MVLRNIFNIRYLKINFFSVLCVVMFIEHIYNSAIKLHIDIALNDCFGHHDALGLGAPRTLSKGTAVYGL